MTTTNNSTNNGTTTANRLPSNTKKKGGKKSTSKKSPTGQCAYDLLVSTEVNKIILPCGTTFKVEGDKLPVSNWKQGLVSQISASEEIPVLTPPKGHIQSLDNGMSRKARGPAKSKKALVDYVNALPKVAQKLSAAEQAALA